MYALIRNKTVASLSLIECIVPAYFNYPLSRLAIGILVLTATSKVVGLRQQVELLNNSEMSQLHGSILCLLYIYTNMIQIFGTSPGLEHSGRYTAMNRFLPLDRNCSTYVELLNARELPFPNARHPRIRFYRFRHIQLGPTRI
jgi:hypothetical protein